MITKEVCLIFSLWYNHVTSVGQQNEGIGVEVIDTFLGVDLIKKMKENPLYIKKKYLKNLFPSRMILEAIVKDVEYQVQSLEPSFSTVRSTA